MALKNLKEPKDTDQAEKYEAIIKLIERAEELGEAINKLTEIMNNDWNKKKDILPKRMEAFKTSLGKFNAFRISNRENFFKLLKSSDVELETIEKAIKKSGQFKKYSELITAPFKRQPLYLCKPKDEETPNVPEGGILGLIEDEELV